MFDEPTELLQMKIVWFYKTVEVASTLSYRVSLYQSHWSVFYVLDYDISHKGHEMSMLRRF